MLTCRTTIALLADYLDASLSGAVVAELESHVAGCDECRAYLSTYRRTRELTARVLRAAMPETVRARLRELRIAISGRDPS